MTKGRPETVKLREVLKRVVSGCVRLLHFLWALIILFVEWGWHPLSELLAALTRFTWVARLEHKIECLSPYPALFLFLLPLGFLVPIKIVSLWMVVKGEVVAALALVLLAKVLTTAVVARTFKLTKSKILSINWFSRFYDRFVAWKQGVFLILRASIVWELSRKIKATIHARATDVLAWVRVNN